MKNGSLAFWVIISSLLFPELPSTTPSYTAYSKTPGVVPNDHLPWDFTKIDFIPAGLIWFFVELADLGEKFDGISQLVENIVEACFFIS